MKKIFRVFAVIFVILLIISLASYVDYYISKKNNTHPKIALKKEVKDGEYVYNAFLYRVWYCTANKTYTFGGYKDVGAVCTSNYKYVNGLYINGAGLTIAEKDLEMIKDYFDYEIIETFNSEKQVSNAVNIVMEYKNLEFSFLKNESGEVLSNFIEFKEFVKSNDRYEWKYTGKTKYCYKESDGIKYKAIYENDACGEFQEIKLSSEWCENSSLSSLSNSKEKTKYCTEQ